MSSNVFRFTELDAQRPKRRSASTRIKDFQEIYRQFTEAAAENQSSRCSQCGVPFCQSGCPLENNIPDWLRLAANGEVREAYDVSAATNPMPEVCGRICPQDRLCEQACVIEQSGHGAVTIGAVEKHLTDMAWDNGWVPPIAVGAPSGLSVGIIGAGPAGLAAAERLREYGHAVTVYDRYDRIGGLMVYGIPNFKLDKAIVTRRAERLRAAGVEFVLNTDVGRDVSLAQLRNRHDSVLIAAGVYQARALGVDGDASRVITPALQFLTAANRDGFGDQRDPADAHARDKRVVVIGGGDTAMDCVRTAVRQGAKSVTCLYRRDRDNMPGSAREVRSAEDEGVDFQWLSAPKTISSSSGGAGVVTAIAMRLAGADASGRRAPEPVAGSERPLDADLVIPALGYDGEDFVELFAASDLATTKKGLIEAKPVLPEHGMELGSGVTSLNGVFAAGDCVRGASLVVWALRDGLRVAAQIHHWLLQSAARDVSSAA